MNINENLAPDDVLKVNSETGVVTLNGNEVFDISGEIFDLKAGTNAIEYTDSESSRDLELEVKFTERYV